MLGGSVGIGLGILADTAKELVKGLVKAGRPGEG